MGAIGLKFFGNSGDYYLLIGGEKSKLWLFFYFLGHFWWDIGRGHHVRPYWSEVFKPSQKVGPVGGTHAHIWACSFGHMRVQKTTIYRSMMRNLNHDAYFSKFQVKILKNVGVAILVIEFEQNAQTEIQLILWHFWGFLVIEFIFLEIFRWNLQSICDLMVLIK